MLRPNAPFTDDEIYEWFTAYYELILTDEPIVTSEYSGKLLYKTFDARTNEILKANVPPPSHSSSASTSTVLADGQA